MIRFKLLCVFLIAGNLNLSSVGLAQVALDPLNDSKPNSEKKSHQYFFSLLKLHNMIPASSFFEPTMAKLTIQDLDLKNARLEQIAHQLDSAFTYFGAKPLDPENSFQKLYQLLNEAHMWRKNLSWTANGLDRIYAFEKN